MRCLAKAATRYLNKLLEKQSAKPKCARPKSARGMTNSSSHTLAYEDDAHDGAACRDKNFAMYGKGLDLD